MNKATPSTTALKENAQPKRTAYTVVNGPIAPNGGHASKGFQTGDIVHLTASQAKHYMKLGRLAPVIDDEKEDSKDEGKE